MKLVEANVTSLQVKGGVDRTTDLTTWVLPSVASQISNIMNSMFIQPHKYKRAHYRFVVARRCRRDWRCEVAGGPMTTWYISGFAIKTPTRGQRFGISFTLRPCLKKNAFTGVYCTGSVRMIGRSDASNVSSSSITCSLTAYELCVDVRTWPHFHLLLPSERALCGFQHIRLGWCAVLVPHNFSASACS